MRQSRLKRFWSEFRDQPWIFQFGEWLALVFIAAGLLLPGPVRAADQVMRNKDAGLEIRLMERPCADALREHIKPEYRDQFQSARATIRGSRFEGCWIADGEDITLIFENGEWVAMNRSQFSDPHL